MGRLIACWLLLTTALLSTGSYADPQSKSFSHWQFDDRRISATFTIGNLEIARLPGYQPGSDFEQVLAEHLGDTIQLTGSNVDCAMNPPVSRRARPGYVQLYLEFQCPESDAALQLSISSLQQAVPSHVHFARFKINDQPAFESLFSRRQPSLTLQLFPNPEQGSAQQNRGGTLLSYIVFGFEHILVGLDHIAFLLTLLLLTRRLRDIVWIVTGFTVGHSITLSLATLGLVTPNSYWVEAMIGFTIALIAIENISARTGCARQAAWISGFCLVLMALYSASQHAGPPLLGTLGLALFALCYLQLGSDEQQARRLRPLVTTGFGLIHGFGFANVLMEVGLPDRQVVPALFGFNVGVEIGQLVIVFGLAGAGVVVRKLTREGVQILLRDNLSAALCGLGVFWFVGRIYV